ncbi:uncharacterized protein LOC113866901 [Abrus precatorius]|uniref:Uncharacterized protein LOC113866901 n=1 Tax=Abrus precatorius TaxID=3816 RepID=A0A8B8LML1_ABRPR|nr:uncharacterized protein LOC113866901 [Abrus precatorius]
MATVYKLSAFVFLFVFLAYSLALSSSTEPTISASSNDLPYVTAPDIASFFPTPSADRPMSSAAPPEAEALAPAAPSSGEFVGKKASGSSRLDCAAVTVGILLCNFLIASTII